MIERTPKPLKQLQEESSLTNRIMGMVNDNSEVNSHKYSDHKEDPEEFYYTSDEPFRRTENYTINGEPVSKYMRGKNG